MEIEEIYKNVAEVIENSVGTPKESIGLDQTLFDELGVDSIDLVDILFELESLYDIELKINDIESIALSFCKLFLLLTPDLIWIKIIG